MFAGKTTKMIEILRKEKENNTNKITIAIKHSADTRRKPTSRIVTADGIEFRSTLRTQRLMNIYGMILSLRADIVAIDEGHFFEDLTLFCQGMKIRKIKVYVTALVSTYNRTPFPNMVNFVPDSIMFLSNLCQICNEANASFSMRHHHSPGVNKPDLIHVGGKEIYSAVCRSCHHNHSRW